MTPSEIELCKFFRGFGLDLVESFENQIESFEKQGKQDVEAPKHYKTDCGMEVIDIIDAFDLNFNLGNAVKYILRAGKKEDEVMDLEKAVWYVKRQISKLEDADE